MTQREKNLAIAVAALVLGYGGWVGWNWWGDALADRASRLNSAEVAVAEAQLREAAARASLRRLEAYRERSLPRDVETAQSQYRDWLVEQFEASGMLLEQIQRTTAPIDRGGAYTTMSFKAQAGGELRDVAKFLHAFYSNAATHKFTRLKLTPSEPKGQLRMDVDVEAIIVGGTGRKSGLPEEPSERLREPTADAYVASVAGRELFAEYVPPPPPRPPRVEKKVVRSTPPPPAPFDHSTKARFTGAVGSGASMQAWIRVLTTGETLRLSAGDELNVGLLAARVVEVGARELIYEADSERFIVSLGEYLRDGTLLPDEPLL